MNSSPLSLHSPSGVLADYHALTGAVAVVDRSDRCRLEMKGKGAVDALNGLVTNDVTLLAAGRGMHAAALTAKGRMVADLRIFMLEENALLVDTPAASGEGWLNVVRKFVNPRLAKYENVSASTADIGFFGPQAPQLLATLLSTTAVELSELEPHSLRYFSFNDTPVRVAATFELQVPGFDVFLPREVSDDLVQAAEAGGARKAAHEAFHIARVEAGTPEWGIEMDDHTLVQEANLDRRNAVSYTKGCYTGQEVVARVHFRGHVNQHLRSVNFPDQTVPPVGATLHGDHDKQVGTLRSAVFGPSRGAVGIAMIRREIDEGAALSVRWTEGATKAVCGPLAGDMQ